MLVANAALSLWDYDAWDAVSTRHVELARATGALAPLANALNAHRVIALWRGDVDSARVLGLEEQTVKEVTGTRRASYGDLFLLAYQGHAAKAAPLLAAAAEEATARGEGLGLQITDRANALLQAGSRAVRGGTGRRSACRARAISARSPGRRCPTWSRPRSAAARPTPRPRRSPG